MANLCFWLKCVGWTEVVLYFLEFTVWIVTIIFQENNSNGLFSLQQIPISFLSSLAVLSVLGTMALIGFVCYWPQYAEWKLIVIFTCRIIILLISTGLLFTCFINEAQISIYIVVPYPMVHISCAVMNLYQLYKYSRSVL